MVTDVRGWVGQFSREVADEHTWMTLVQGCRSRGELAAELGELTRLLEAHFVAREAPGGLIEQALARVPDDPRALQLGAAQREAWDALQRAMQRLQRGDDGEVGIEEVELRLRRLRAVQDALLGSADDDEPSA